MIVFLNGLGEDCLKAPDKWNKLPVGKQWAKLDKCCHTIKAMSLKCCGCIILWKKLGCYLNQAKTFLCAIRTGANWIHTFRGSFLVSEQGEAGPHHILSCQLALSGALKGALLCSLHLSKHATCWEFKQSWGQKCLFLENINKCFSWIKSNWLDK